MHQFIRHMITMFVYTSFLLVLSIGSGQQQVLFNTTDSLVLQTIQEYKDLCPYNNLCFYSSNITLPWQTVVGVPEPCCKTCTCSDDCGDSCCPDKITQLMSEDYVDNKKQDIYRCMRLQYKPVNNTEQLQTLGYLVVAACPPEYVDNYTNTRCLQSYQDWDLREDLFAFGPVSNSSTIFKNRYCAACNGADVQSLEPLQIEVKCRGPSTYPVVHTLMELKAAIDDNDDCNLLFKPNDSYNFITCEPLVDRCNMSGFWTLYDSKLERACMSYTSVYLDVYKNVHCYLCNKSPEEEVTEVCVMGQSPYQPNSFVALLDFQGLQEVKQTTQMPEVLCPTGYGYDPVKTICRALTCADYLTFSEGTCKSLFLSIFNFAGTVYEVIITVEPRDIIRDFYMPLGSVEILSDTLFYHISDTLETNQSPFTVCQVFGAIFLRKNITELISRLSTNARKQLLYSDVEYFAFRFQLYARSYTDLQAELQQLNLLLKDFRQITELFPYIVRFRQIPLDNFDTAAVLYGTYAGLANTSVDEQAFNSLMLDDVLHYALASSFYEEQSRLTIAPLRLYTPAVCPSLAVFEIEPFCPKLELLENEFTITDDGVSLQKLLITNSEIIFTLNNSVLVCHKTYLTAVDQLRAQNRATDAGEILPATIVTVITLSLSLVSLSVTFITYAACEKLRSLPGLTIMCLVGSLFATHLLTLINGVARVTPGVLCISFGIALHFCLLVSVFWMFINTFHMATVFLSLTKLNSKNTNKFHLFTRYLSFTIIMSVLFVAINIIVSTVKSNYATIGYDDQTCYVDSGSMTGFTVALPIGIVVISNLVMFASVVIKISRGPNMKKHSNQERNNISILAKLSTLTGITWVFGFLYQFTSYGAFSYIFIVLNAGQGLFIMVGFVLNRRTAAIIKTQYSEKFKRNSTSNSVVTS